MRRGDLIRLRWQDIDLGRRLACLSDTKNGEDRIVPLSSEALAVLQTMPRRIDGRLFSLEPRGFSKAMRKSVVRARRAYEADCALAGVVPDPEFVCDLRLHDARHEAVSAFFERGLDVMEVASISGHKTLSCLKRYTHMRAERLALKLA
jgi:integrase